MIANKVAVHAKYSNQFYILFHCNNLLNTLFAIEVVIFVDTISIRDIVPSQAITEVSANFFKNLLFSQTHVLEF